MWPLNEELKETKQRDLRGRGKWTEKQWEVRLVSPGTLQKVFQAYFLFGSSLGFPYNSTISTFPKS